MDNFTKSIQLISYFDLFDYPVKRNELQAITGISDEEWEHVRPRILDSGKTITSGDYYFAEGKEWTVKKRTKEEAFFQQHKNKILRSARIISLFPFVRGILLSGSSARGILDTHSDFDFFIITARNRMWLCRTLIMIFRKIISLNFRTSNIKQFCCNYFVTEDNLTIRDQNEYTALEVLSAQPVYNKALYEKFLQANIWIQKYYQFKEKEANIASIQPRFTSIKTIIEKLCNSVWNEKIELWLIMKHYHHWTAKGIVAHAEDFKSRADLLVINHNSPYRMEFLVDKLRQLNAAECRNKIRTKVMLKKLSCAENKQKDTLDIVFTSALFHSDHNGKIHQTNASHLVKRIGENNYRGEWYDEKNVKGVENLSRYLFTRSPGLVAIDIDNSEFSIIKRLVTVSRTAGSVVILWNNTNGFTPADYIRLGGNIIVMCKFEDVMADVLDAVYKGKQPIDKIDGIFTEKILFDSPPSPLSFSKEGEEVA